MEIKHDDVSTENSKNIIDERRAIVPERKDSPMEKNVFSLSRRSSLHETVCIEWLNDVLKDSKVTNIFFGSEGLHNELLKAIARTPLRLELAKERSAVLHCLRPKLVSCFVSINGERTVISPVLGEQNINTGILIPRLRDNVLREGYIGVQVAHQDHVLVETTSGPGMNPLYPRFNTHLSSFEANFLTIDVAVNDGHNDASLIERFGVLTEVHRMYFVSDDGGPSRFYYRDMPTVDHPPSCIIYDVSGGVYDPSTDVLNPQINFAKTSAMGATSGFHESIVNSESIFKWTKYRLINPLVNNLREKQKKRQLGHDVSTEPFLPVERSNDLLGILQLGHANITIGNHGSGKSTSLAGAVYAYCSSLLNDICLQPSGERSYRELPSTAHIPAALRGVGAPFVLLIRHLEPREIRIVKDIRTAIAEAGIKDVHNSFYELEIANASPSSVTAAIDKIRIDFALGDRPILFILDSITPVFQATARGIEHNDRTQPGGIGGNARANIQNLSGCAGGLITGIKTVAAWRLSPEKEALIYDTVSGIMKVAFEMSDNRVISMRIRDFPCFDRSPFKKHEVHDMGLMASNYNYQ